MTMHGVETTIASGLLSAALLAAPSAGSTAAGAAWRHDPVWDDGRAEYCAYAVEWRRYGRSYEGRATLVLVKEPWAPDLEVKADRPRPDGFEVLKLNHVRDVPTGVYSYHQMASIFLRRDTGELRKIVSTSSEACGISTASMTEGELETRSYFDGEGERRSVFPEGALPEDGLPALLRDFVAGELPGELRVVPTLMTGRFGDLSPRGYRLRRSPGVVVETPAGRFQGIEVRLDRPGETLTYTFDERAPHKLLRFSDTAGTRYELARCERLVYWTMTEPPDREWLPESVR